MPCGCSHMQRGRCAEKSDVTFSVLGKANSVWAAVQLMAILECRTMIVNNAGKVSWWLCIVFKSMPFGLRMNCTFFFLCICDEIDPAVFLPLFLASSFSFSFSLTIITTIMEAMRDARQKRHTISGIDPHPSPHRKKTWVQGLHNSDWTVRSIGCSISRCHGNSQSKDRAPAFIYTCLLLLAT